MNNTRVIKNEKGSVLVIALVMLALLTLLGISATSTSNIELQIAGNERNYKRTFYTANSGIEHARSALNAEMVNANQANIAMALPMSWSFALADAADTSFEGGALYLENTSFVPLNNYNYSVTIWDDNDDSDPTTDSNSVIFAQANANGPNNSTVKLRVMLRASIDGETINSYTAQQGGEAGKGYGSQDLNPIDDDDFEYQM